jgi:hypothetical protein
LPDKRKAKGKQYAIEELVMSALTLFLLKEGSRNRINNHRREGYFMKHYLELMFGLRLAHQDTTADLLCDLPDEHPDQVKMNLMSELIMQKWLREYRLLNKYYMVVIDATGVMVFDERHCEHCLTKTSSKGKVTYFHYVLEAKLVTHDGHAISLATEWIENPAGEFKKQDCEREAFKRLAAKLKKQYPRLPICILADGLYPYENAFKICEDNGWKFIFVLQDKSLKTVQEELVLTRRTNPLRTFFTAKKGWYITDEYRYQTHIKYHGKYTLNWIECTETRNKMPEREGRKTKENLPTLKKNHFEYVTNLIPDNDNVHAIATGGRLRWKIESEGFNTQKNNGYELEHKYARKSYNALKNYYTLLQIAHAINQLIEKGKCITEILKRRPKETLSNLWDTLRAFMIFCPPRSIYDCAQTCNCLRPAPS